MNENMLFTLEKINFLFMLWSFIIALGIYICQSETQFYAFPNLYLFVMAVSCLSLGAINIYLIDYLWEENVKYIKK